MIVVKILLVNFNNLDIFYHPDIELAIFFARKNLAKFDPTHSTTPTCVYEMEEIGSCRVN